MANAELIGQRPRRRAASSGPVAAPGTIRAPIAVMDAHDRETMVFTRNEVMQEALGGRTWVGALTNVAGGPCDDVTIQIGFHDRDGRPVGAPVTARAARLGPGAGLHLQARLPVAAVGMRVRLLRWTAGGGIVAPGPFGRRVFGSAQT